MEQNNNDYMTIKRKIISLIVNDELVFYPRKCKKYGDEVRSEIRIHLNIEGKILHIITDKTYKLCDWGDVEDEFDNKGVDWSNSEKLKFMNDICWYITQNKNEAGFWLSEGHFYASDIFIDEVVKLLCEELDRWDWMLKLEK